MIEDARLFEGADSKSIKYIIRYVIRRHRRDDGYLRFQLRKARSIDHPNQVIRDTRIALCYPRNE